MGFFSKRESSSNALSKSLITFLNKADAEYMKAYAVKTTRSFATYASRECAIKVTQLIMQSTNRYFGTDKFRNTVWTLQEDNAGVLSILKSVTFDKIRVAGYMSIAVETDYKETWIVDSTDGKNYKIVDIKLVHK